MNIHSIYAPISRYFRAQRMLQFSNDFVIKQEHRILDVGGTPFNWMLLDSQPLTFFVNLTGTTNAKNWVIADGCVLPFGDQSFDIVFSNSVIEHLGSFKNQRDFAAECQRVGASYYVQTPNKWFFIEPHLIAPFIHWLPRRWQLFFMRNFTIRGLLLRPNRQECERFLAEVRLLDEKEMRELFPDAAIWREKFLGFTKSLIAVHKP